MAHEAYYASVKRWLASRNGDTRCPKCGADEWAISDPDYPVIECVCGSCGHVVLTDTATVAAAGGD